MDTIHDLVFNLRQQLGNDKANALMFGALLLIVAVGVWVVAKLTRRKI